MKIQLISVLALCLGACSATVDPMGAGGGDDAPGGGGGGGDDTSGDDDVVIDGDIGFLETSVRDERGDAIDFTTGEPVHTHAGVSVPLGAAGCPDVYKYAYLMDQAPPRFGRQLAPNPLTWKVGVADPKSLDLSMAAYRVRTADDTLLLDWTKLPALTGSTTTITLQRAGDVPIPALGERSGALYLDVRAVALDGSETIASTCWNHHPLAAPIEVQQARPEPTGLAAMTFAAGAPISDLIMPPREVAVFSQRFVHHTAEPVTLSIDLAVPTATFQKRVADDWVITSTGTTNTLCSNDFDGFESTEPICSEVAPVEPPNPSTAGMLASGAWSLSVIDEATHDPVTTCTISNLHATCQLPARGTTGSAQVYRAVLAVRDVRDLAPAASGPFAELALNGLGFTGRLVETTQRCTLLAPKVFPNGTTAVFCKRFADYTRFVALDTARLAFAAVPFTLAATPSALAPVAPLAYVPPAQQAAAPFTWDAGNANLPSEL